jgi:hypothetical protein
MSDITRTNEELNAVELSDADLETVQGACGIDYCGGGYEYGGCGSYGYGCGGYGGGFGGGYGGGWYHHHHGGFFGGGLLGVGFFDPCRR